MLCGLDAINHILINQGRPPVQRDILDDIAENVALLEAEITPEATSAQPHREGNYHITVMTIALKQLTDHFVRVCRPEKCDHKEEIAFIIGNGHHWQALVKEGNYWFLRDKESFEVNNLHNFLLMASRRGIVLALTKNMPPSGDMDWEATAAAPVSRKRPLEAAADSENSATPCISC